MDNTLLTDVSFVNIFFQSVSCLLILLTLSFAKKFLVWMKSRSSVLPFMDHSSGVSPSYSRSSKFPPMLSSWSFPVLCFTSRSMMDFELIFEKSIRPVTRFCFPFFHWMSSCLSTTCWNHSGFAGGSVVKNPPPANAGDTSSMPDLGRSHMPWGIYAHVPQLLNLCSRARSLWGLELCSTAREATTTRSLCTAARG